MARAICTQCGNEFHWYGGRGHKLADIVSPCCKASAKGKSGNRKPPIKRPSIKVEAQQDSLIRGRWVTEKTTITMLPDERIYTTWRFLWHHVLRATEEIHDGWRLFVDDRPYEVNYRCRIREDDWQRLLTKGNPNTNIPDPRAPGDYESGDAARITPDAAGDAVTADEPARPVDTLRVAWNAAHIIARLRGYQSDAYRRMQGVFDSMRAYSRLTPQSA